MCKHLLTLKPDISYYILYQWNSLYDSNSIVRRHPPLDITASNLCDIIAWKKEMGNFPEIRELLFGTSPDRTN